jgi:HemY protein
MRATLWLLGLFGVAVALALFAGNNQATVTVFWPPYRVDLSLNLVVLLLLGGFVLVYAALRALSALLALPSEARRWRLQQRERGLHAALVDAWSYLLAGRFLRARKSAEAALAQERSLGAGGEKLANASQLRAMAHLVAAEASQSLQDRIGRDEHLDRALEQVPARASGSGAELREGAQLRAARWALDDRDPTAALARLAELPQGAARRTLALRIKLKAARLAHQTLSALETARLLAKHRAFSTTAAESLVRGLAIELISGAHDTSQLLRVWGTLENSERAMPELAVHAAQRLMALQGDPTLARSWLLPAWDRMVEPGSAVGEQQRIKLVRALEAGLDTLDTDWLARVETAQQRNPREPNLQYLAGMAFLKRQLWGKAQQLLTQAALGLKDPVLHRNAWRALAQLAEQRGDGAAASIAWKNAAEA